jgi:two-component system chemotaxis sensor kinase CheA
MSNADLHKNAFLEEAYELLAELETTLLELEDTPDDLDIIGRIFRAMHTIKGSGAMFGFDEISAFTHEVETIFDLVRNGEMAATKELIDLTLSARDHIKVMLDSPDTNAEHKQEGDVIVEALKKLAPRTQTDQQPVSEGETVSEDNNPLSDELERKITYRIRFRPSPDIFAVGNNPVYLLNDLRSLGDCSVIAHKEEIPLLQDMDPESCYVYWDAVLTTKEGINAIKDVFIFVADDCKLDINVIDDSGGFDEAALSNEMHERGFITKEATDQLKASYKRLGEILVDRGDITQYDLNKALETQRPIGEVLVEAGLVDRATVESALAEQQRVKEIRKNDSAVQQKKVAVAQQRQIKSETASSIRVASDKLDKLVDLVGELVTVQARLTQTSSSRNDPEILSIAEEVEHLTNELRDNTMSVRMVPIGSMFSKFKRLVRDLSAETGKEIEMTTEGAETELDKTVIERLNDPLVHLIRNSIDHGIELPQVRETNTKTRQGLVHLSARHSGANVLIEIKDDGAGLNAEAIKAKAVELGLIDAGAEVSEKELFQMILAAGFSTAQKVTSVSGRGVGMDVVKQNIEALRGSIEISSEKGAGTTITLKLPLTLAIIDGLLVEIGDDYYVMPLSLVEECVELTRDDVARAHGRQIANVRGEIVPYISLREQFSFNGDKPDIEQIVIVSIKNQRVGFVVDDVVGEHQTVIKTLGKFYKDVEGLSGATILGDGTVALILDVPKLFQKVEQEEIGCTIN